MEWWLGQLKWLVVVVLLVGSLAVMQCAPLQDWKEFPLTTRDLKLIKIGGEVPITTNSINATCLLTPAEQDSGDRGCTWRTQQECRRIPTITTVPVYSPWCQGKSQGAHLTNCKETVQTVPIVHSVKVCSPTGTPDCRGPCYNCGQYCAPAQQSWCEQSHSISTLVSDKRECREVEGEECEDMLKRTEKDVVKSTENCYQKDVELCGPVNCKFVNITTECHEKNSTIQVELRKRECEVCEPTLAEKVKVEQDCQEVLTDDCNTDPLSRTWMKFCGEDEEAKYVETKKFKFEDIEEPRSRNNLENNKFSVEDLIHESLAPVNNLVFETLKQIHIEDIESSTPIVIISKSQESSTEDVSGILKLLDLEEEILAVQELQSNPTTININVQLDPNISDISRAPSSAVYFDQILNTLRKQTQLDNTSSSALSTVYTPSPQSLTEVLDLQLQSQFLQSTTKPKNNMSKKKIVSEIENTISSPKTTKILPSEGNPELLTTSAPTPTLSTPATKEGVTKGDKKLSAAEFLRRCFISHTGCDFSQNEIEGKDTTEEDVTSISPVTAGAPISIRTTEAPRKPKNIQERLKQRVKLCFFSGLCNDNDFRVTTKRPETTTTQRLTTSANLRATEIQRRVQERARACFFEGKCN